MITLTETARKQILSILEARGKMDNGIRVRIAGATSTGYKHELSFVAPGQEEPDDTIIEVEGFRLFVDADSSSKMEGTGIDFSEEGSAVGFSFDNPNKVKWSDPEKGREVQRLIDSEINPALAGHGGFVEIHDVKDDMVYVRLGGGCKGCGMANVTIKDVVEKVLKEKVTGIKGVVDLTDHGNTC